MPMRTHADFYPEYSDLAIDPYAIEGTTRERFITILSSLSPRDQAKVLGPDTRQGAHAEAPARCKASYQCTERQRSRRDKLALALQRPDWQPQTR